MTGELSHILGATEVEGIRNFEEILKEDVFAGKVYQCEQRTVWCVDVVHKFSGVNKL